MKTRIIGDIHGKLSRMQELLNIDTPYSAPEIERSIQIGDYGIGFDTWSDQRMRDFQVSYPDHRFIRGNHDDPAACKKMSGYIADGTIEDRTMFVGGAWSIDHGFRTIGIDWWDDEQLSQAQFDIIKKTYDRVRPDVMITHDAPIDISDDMFIKTGLAMGGQNAKQIPNRTNTNLQAMLDIHQPKFWFFGHWHHNVIYDRGDTRFICLGELQWLDFDFKTLTVEGASFEYPGSTKATQPIFAKGTRSSRF
jgi:hypothetical protein